MQNPDILCKSTRNYTKRCTHNPAQVLACERASFPLIPTSDIRRLAGLSCIFQPFAQANNSELDKEHYNSEEPVRDLVLGLQRHVPAATTLPMSWLRDTCLSGLNWESDSEEVSYLLLVDYDLPPEPLGGSPA